MRLILVLSALIIATMSGTAGATNADRPSPHRHLEGMAGMAAKSVVERPRIPAERPCIICEVTKPASSFDRYRYTTNQGKQSVRLSPRCKACESERRRVRQQLRPEDPARSAVRYREWARRNPEKIRAIKRRYHKNNAAIVYAKRLLARYGVTVDAINALRVQQDYRCAICRIHESETKRGRLVIDHDHATTRVRALLCDNCNVAIAHVHEDITVALAVVEFLRKHKGNIACA